MTSSGNARAKLSGSRRSSYSRSELFEKQGYERTTVEELTRLAGVSRPTFFRYFDAKEDGLFWDEGESVALMVDSVSTRVDRVLVEQGRTPARKWTALTGLLS